MGYRIDDVEKVGIAHEVYVTAENTALPYARTTIEASEPDKVRFKPGGLPPAPAAPKSLRKKWGFD